MVQLIFDFCYLLQDIARVEASIDKFSKQMEVFRTEKDRWMSRFKASRAQLIELQNEIAEMVTYMTSIMALNAVFNNYSNFDSRTIRFFNRI